MQWWQEVWPITSRLTSGIARTRQTAALEWAKSAGSLTKVAVTDSAYVTLVCVRTLSANASKASKSNPLQLICEVCKQVK